MAKMLWDQVSEKLYETGVEQCALYPQEADGTYPLGVPWNGLIGVTDSPSGAEPSPLYANNKKYVELMSAEEWGGSIEAYTYPPEFGECNGQKEVIPGMTIGQQTRKGFGLVYKTLIGNDTEGTKHGYKLHIRYGCKAAPSERSNHTVSDSPEAMTMSWEVSSTPVEVEGFDPTATFDFDSTTIDAGKLAALEAILYGSAEEEPRLPLPAELVQIMSGDAA